MTARLDRRRLPKPAEEWTLATSEIGIFLSATADGIGEAERQAEEARERASLPPGA